MVRLVHEDWFPDAFKAETVRPSIS
jgi:hypothetical protein